MESQSETIQTVFALKLPMLKTGDYKLWSMRIEQYLTHTDYALWEVIVNGDEPAAIALVSGSAEGVIPPKTTAEKISRRNELKAKNNTSSTNEAVNTAHNVSTASSQGQASTSTYAYDVMFSFFANQSNSPQLDNKDLEQIDTNDLEEMDLKWQVAMLTMSVKRFIKKTGRNLNFNGNETVGLDKTKDHPVQILSQWSSKDKTSLGYDSQLNKRDLNNKSNVFESASDGNVNESAEDTNQANDRYKVGEGYRAVHPPYTRNFMPPRPNLSFARLDDFVYKYAISETITSVNETKTSTSKTSKENMEKPKTVRPSAPIIKD
nr:ribonuclease H-like domain-containing protein [Tanacetum cinerariifolium]